MVIYCHELDKNITSQPKRVPAKRDERRSRRMSGEPVATNPIMRLSFLLIPLLLSNPTTLLAQWTRFNLQSAVGDQFTKQAEPLLRGAALWIGHHPLYRLDEKKRLRLGASIITGIDLTGSDLTRRQIKTVPILDGSFVITSNLLLTGKISGFSSGSDVIQVISYGLDLSLSRTQETGWIFSMNIASLQGAEDFRIKSHDALIHTTNTWKRTRIHYGVGTNIYEARIFMSDIESIPSKIEGQTNYLLLGLIIPVAALDFGTQIQIHPKFITLSFDTLIKVH